MRLLQVERVDLLVGLVIDNRTGLELITNSRLTSMAYLVLILRSKLILATWLIFNHRVVAKVEVDVEAMMVL